MCDWKFAKPCVNVVSGIDHRSENIWWLLFNCTNWCSSRLEHTIFLVLRSSRQAPNSTITSSTLPKTNLLNPHTLIPLRIRFQLIHIQHQHIPLHIHQHKAGSISVFLLADPERLVHPAVRARRAARVHEKLALHLVRFELARAAPAQHVDVHLPRGDQQRVRVARRHDAVAVREPDAQTAVRDDFAEGGRDGEAGGAVLAGAAAGLLLLAVGRGGRGGGAEGDVEVAFDELKVWGDAAQEGVDGGGGQVAQAEDLADFAGGEEFLELFGGVEALAGVLLLGTELVGEREGVCLLLCIQGRRTFAGMS